MKKRPAKCFSCGAQILWAVTAAGKRIPLDAAACPRGNVLLTENGAWARVLTAAEMSARQELRLSGAVVEPAYLSHFATCKFAESHRRKS